MTGRIVIQKFFAKFPVIDKGALTIQDFDYLLAIRSDQSIGLLTIEQFARVELLTLLKETSTPRFKETIPSVANVANAANAANTAIVSGATAVANSAVASATAAIAAASTPANSKDEGKDGSESLGGVVWSRIRRIVDAATPDTANIKSWSNKTSVDKMKLHAESLVKRNLLPANANFHQYRWLIDEDLRRAENQYIMLQQSVVSLTPMEKKSWAAICLWASLDPKMSVTEKKNLDLMTSGISEATKTKFKNYVKDTKITRDIAAPTVAPPESMNPPSNPPRNGAPRGRGFPGEPPKNVADELSRLASFVDDKNNKDMSEAVKGIISTIPAIGAALANVVGIGGR